MNLFLLIKTRNARLERSIGVDSMRMMIDGLYWHGVQVAPGDGVLRLENVSECEPFRSRCDHPGWYMRSVRDEATVHIRLVDGDRIAAERTVQVGPSSFDPVVLPWPLDPPTGKLDLEIACEGPGRLFIAAHFALDRDALLKRCTGRGVEIGPGPAPRIFPSEQTQLLYVEQKLPDEWEQLYGASYKVKFDPSLEPYYVVGEAHAIPAEEGSLDFIFSSHVFEHLANPLGHLERWSKLLRPGGEVVMVVPDYIGSKDFLATATTMREVLEEYELGAFEPTPRHYQRFAESRGGTADAGKLLQKKASIHVHYYTNDNMAGLLRHAVEKGWFRSFSLIHSRNAKDFQVVLSR